MHYSFHTQLSCIIYIQAAKVSSDDVNADIKKDDYIKG